MTAKFKMQYVHSSIWDISAICLSKGGSFLCQVLHTSRTKMSLDLLVKIEVTPLISMFSPVNIECRLLHYFVCWGFPFLNHLNSAPCTGWFSKQVLESLTSTAAPAKASAPKNICALSSSEFNVHLCRYRPIPGNTVGIVEKHSCFGKVLLPTQSLAI